MPPATKPSAKPAAAKPAAAKTAASSKPAGKAAATSKPAGKAAKPGAKPASKAGATKTKSKASPAGKASSSGSSPSKDPEPVAEPEAPAPEAAAAEPAEPEPPALPSGPVRVRYNHYNNEFDVVDGRLDFEEVDEAYAISFVFKGDWKVRLKSKDGTIDTPPDGGALIKGVDEEGDPKVEGFFSNLSIEDADGVQQLYELVVEEDPALADAPRKTYTASSKVVGRVIAGDDDEPGMGEDSSSCSCLFGNPCASSYNCKDWQNRFEVAKKNGWKGFS